MYKNKKILALIPARSGSKGLKNKNIKILQGKPLIAWTIIGAKGSKYIDNIIVTTDSKRIANISKTYGANIPFIRPARLATDNAKSIDVVVHAINWLKDNSDHYDILVLLQPTSPLRNKDDINKAIEYFVSINAQSLISVCETEHNPLWSNTLPKDNRMSKFLRPEIVNKNRQDLPKYYRINGAIYIANIEYLIKNKSFIGPGSYAYLMPRERSVDINDQLDFSFAEFLL